MAIIATQSLFTWQECLFLQRQVFLFCFVHESLFVDIQRNVKNGQNWPNFFIKQRKFLSTAFFTFIQIRLTQIFPRLSHSRTKLRLKLNAKSRKFFTYWLEYNSVPLDSCPLTIVPRQLTQRQLVSLTFILKGDVSHTANLLCFIVCTSFLKRKKNSACCWFLTSKYCWGRRSNP